MEPERRDEWAARVVAWHHRDPLALRVTPQQVGEFGWVDLPFAGGARRSRWRPVFTEKVLESVSARRLAAWARRHGQESRPEADGLPLHQVEIDRARVPAGVDAVVLWLVQATLQTPAGPVKVLLDSRPGGAVLGQRRRSKRRVAVAVLALAAVAALTGGFAWVVQGGRGDEVAVPVAASAPAAASAASGPASVASAALPASSASAPQAASAPAAAASAAAAASTASAVAAALAPPAVASAASRPVARVSVAPSAPIITPRALDADGRRLREPPAFLLGDDERLAARQAGEAARAASAARRADRHETAYALVTRPARTTAESRLLGRDLESALASLKGAPRCPRVDVMPAGDDWRAVCWPLLKRDEAQRLRDLLVERGQRVEMIEF